VSYRLSRPPTAPQPRDPAAIAVAACVRRSGSLQQPAGCCAAWRWRRRDTGRSISPRAPLLGPPLEALLPFW